MSKNTLMVAGLALILAIGALVLQFALPGGGGVSDADLEVLRGDVAMLKQQSAADSVRIAVLDAEEAFQVFMVATQDLRERITEKSNEITALQAAYQAGTVSTDEANRRLAELQGELLEAQANTIMGTLDRMVDSDGFADIRAQLIQISEQAQPIVQAIRELVSAVKVGSIDSPTFSANYTALKARYTELDNVVVNAATTALIKAAEDIALEFNYDLVLIKRDVIAYSDDAAVIDITNRVKAEIEDYL